MSGRTADRPRRELVHSEVRKEFGLVFLEITVWRSGGARKDGTVRHRQLTTRYLLAEKPPGVFTLTTTDGQSYETTASACTCRDARYRGRRAMCKHRSALFAQGLLGEDGQ